VAIRPKKIISSRGESGVGAGPGRGTSLGSPQSRARLAVSENKKALDAAARKAKNDAIKKTVTKKTGR
jgi:hypothetical protein